MKRIVLLLSVISCSPVATVEFEVSKLFGADMVLQRDAQVPVWGRAAPGTEVSIAVADQTATAAADVAGDWRVELEPMAAGGPYEFVVTSGKKSMKFGNVLVGDVWVCSGQSNMERVVADTNNAAEEIAIWYQGESNAGAEDAFRYRQLFSTMIRQWRADWGRGDLPFLWVQLANFMATNDQPGDSDWAVLRESQSAALALANTGQAVAIDIGDADDIHPRNKQDVGRRLALAARRVAYGEDLVDSGPVYRAHEVREGRMVINFNHVGGGLVAGGNLDGKLAEFAIAGGDRRFVWAQATIEGDRVVVWNNEVSEPVAVRYAWADNPDGANLYNLEGLPASPFRTDSW